MKSSPSRTARHWRFARSEPALGSEKPWHQISSAVRIFGRKRWTWASVPWAISVGPSMLRPPPCSWSAREKAKDPSCRSRGRWARSHALTSWRNACSFGVNSKSMALGCRGAPAEGAVDLLHRLRRHEGTTQLRGLQLAQDRLDRLSRLGKLNLGLLVFPHLRP